MKIIFAYDHKGGTLVNMENKDACGKEGNKLQCEKGNHFQVCDQIFPLNSALDPTSLQIAHHFSAGSDRIPHTEGQLPTMVGPLCPGEGSRKQEHEKQFRENPT